MTPLSAVAGDDELRHTMRNRWANAQCQDDRLRALLPVVPICRSWFRTQITGYIPRIPSRLRDVSWSSRTLVRDAVDAAATQRKHFARTNGADADGEVVWSW